MKLSNPEKLILLMLSDIYDKLDLNTIDTKIIRSAIHTENTWALDWEIPSIVGSGIESPPPQVVNVVNYLDMWSFLEEAHNLFDSATKEHIAREADPFGKHVRFPGFDANSECDSLSIARILVDDMGRFSRFKGREMNSHAPLIPAYSRMFMIFEKNPTISFRGTKPYSRTSNLHA